jgi:two-component system cell cycle sensor histidine kinase/response regulator CckA
MSEDVRSRLFEPFFTTKSKRGGTGLGLATVYTIVQHCGGHIEVHSEPGAGSAFRIYIPLARDANHAQPPPLLATVAPPPPTAAVDIESVTAGRAARAASVLIVDDDDTTRRLMLRALKRAGYRVFAAEDAFVAQRLFDEHQGSLVLMVTDVQMPGMDGPQLAELLSTRDPNLKLMFVSGESPESLTRQGVIAEGRAFLRKPFSPRAFVERVATLIGASRAPAESLLS